MVKRILLSGSIARHSAGYGGNTWAFLQWVLGFRRLGFDVYYVEECARDRCVDENLNPAPFLESANAHRFRQVVERFDLGDRAAFLEADSPAHVGLSRADIERLIPDIDLYFYQFGGYAAPRGRVRRSVYLDLDPGHTQIWREGHGIDVGLDGHDLYLTLGLNLGEPDCPLPTCGIGWEKTLWPIVLSEWATDEPPGASFTTVANLYDYSWLEWRGVRYGQKAEALDRVIDLPRHVSMPIELCLSLSQDGGEIPKLHANGWHLASPRERTATPDSYRRYIQTSRGEFSIVRPLVSRTGSGWFSDRSGCYLAAGRPVVMEDTGLGRHLPVGEGLLTYTDTESAAQCLEAVQREYARHAEAARNLARQYLDSDRVLGRILALARV
jgi:hypothetical protein